MSSEKATAIVLRVIEFSETSSVVTLFTRDFGKIRALAKGARRPKGPFESALDLLGLCRIVFLRKSSDALDLLTEAKLERRFRPPGGDLSNLYAAYYVAELLNELTDDYDPHPELFDAADRNAGRAAYFECGRADRVALRVDGPARAGTFALAGNVRRVWNGGRSRSAECRSANWPAECCANHVAWDKDKSFRSAPACWRPGAVCRAGVETMAAIELDRARATASCGRF